MTARQALRVSDLGLIAYEEALDLQRSLREARIDGRAPDILLVLEHPPTITLGRRSRPEELLASREVLESQGVHVAEAERGGKITYHGPGQLVVYPILGLRELGLSVPRYVSILEQAMIDWLGTLGLEAARRKGLPGVWVNGRKIGAVGVHLKRWVGIHGFALNVDPDLGGVSGDRSLRHRRRRRDLGRRRAGRRAVSRRRQAGRRRVAPGRPGLRPAGLARRGGRRPHSVANLPQGRIRSLTAGAASNRPTGTMALIISAIRNNPVTSDTAPETMGPTIPPTMNRVTMMEMPTPISRGSTSSRVKGIVRITVMNPQAKPVIRPKPTRAATFEVNSRPHAASGHKQTGDDQ